MTKSLGSSTGTLHFLEPIFFPELEYQFSMKCALPTDFSNFRFLVSTGNETENSDLLLDIVGNHDNLGN